MSDAYEGTPSAESYYERLGVERSASDEDVTKASKRAKLAVHPDNNSSEQATAEREFDRVTDASDALTDNDSRAAYDAFIDDQGPETGTDLYEEWDDAGRPQPPTEWLSEPRSASTTTTSASTATDHGSRARTQAEHRRPNERRQRGEQRTTAADGTAADEETTPTATPKQAPASVLGEDPEELYSKYVLDSETEWGSPEAAAAAETAGQDGDDDAVTARYVPASVDRVVRAVVDTPPGSLLAVPTPKSRLLRLAVVAVWVAVAVVFDPVVGLLAGIPLVFAPRIGPWLYAPLAAAMALAPATVPLETPMVGVAVLAFCSVGYSLLVRGSRLDPYAE